MGYGDEYFTLHPTKGYRPVTKYWRRKMNVELPNMVPA
jgi:hypothetical protein